MTINPLTVERKFRKPACVVSCCLIAYLTGYAVFLVLQVLLNYEPVVLSVMPASEWGDFPTLSICASFYSPNIIDSAHRSHLYSSIGNHGWTDPFWGIPVTNPSAGFVEERTHTILHIPTRSLNPSENASLAFLNSKPALNYTTTCMAVDVQAQRPPQFTNPITAFFVLYVPEHINKMDDAMFKFWAMSPGSEPPDLGNELVNYDIMQGRLVSQHYTITKTIKQRASVFGPTKHENFHAVLTGGEGPVNKSRTGLPPQYTPMTFWLRFNVDDFDVLTTYGKDYKIFGIIAKVGGQLTMLGVLFGFCFVTKNKKAMERTLLNHHNNRELLLDTERDPEEPSLFDVVDDEDESEDQESWVALRLMR